MYKVYYNQKIKKKNVKITHNRVLCGVIYASYIFCTCIFGEKKK